MRKLAPVPSRYEGVFAALGCGGVIFPLLGIAAWWIAHPPMKFWIVFVNSSATMLAGITLYTIDKNTKRLADRPIERDRISAAATAAEKRWRSERGRSFNGW